MCNDAILSQFIILYFCGGIASATDDPISVQTHNLSYFEYNIYTPSTRDTCLLVIFIKAYYHSI